MSRWSTKDWELSPFNFSPEVKRLSKRPSKVIFHDCTLRDGEQQPGLVFDPDDKVEIAQALDALGIQQIEAGTPAVSDDDKAAIRRIARLGLNAKLTALCRLVKEDIDTAIDCGVWGVICSAPAGYLQLDYKLRWSADEFTSKVFEVTDYAKSHGLFVILSPYDTTRSDLKFMLPLIRKAAHQASIDRVRVVDTVGCASFDAIRYLVSRVRRITDMAIEIHCHDDFGFAAANTVAGVLGGANVVSSTVNGIGERSGNAATEEVAMALELLYGVRTGLNLREISRVSGIVRRVSGVALQSHKPVVGENSFRQESGMIVAGFLKMPYTAEPYAPELVGRRPEIVLGKKSGRASLQHKIQGLGLSLREDQVETLLSRVKEESIAKKRVITDEELRGLVDSVSGPKGRLETGKSKSSS